MRFRNDNFVSWNFSAFHIRIYFFTLNDLTKQINRCLFKMLTYIIKVTNVNTLELYESIRIFFSKHGNFIWIYAGTKTYNPKIIRINSFYTYINFQGKFTAFLCSFCSVIIKIWDIFYHQTQCKVDFRGSFVKFQQVYVRSEMLQY